MGIKFPVVRTADDERLNRIQDNIAAAFSSVASTRTPAWIRPDLFAGLTDASGVFSQVAFHLDALGYVHLKGSARNTGASIIIAGATLFVFPPGYRILSTQRFSAFSVSATAISIDAFGLVTSMVNLNVAQQIDFGCTFLAES